jgi:tRNA threonylcarbamoyl adenosine modification protein YeaZ
MTRILAIDGALARCSAAVVVDGEVLAGRHQDAARGHAALLPALAQAVLADAGVAAPTLDLIAVTVGPGSFTGVRAGLALAHGIALAAGVPLVGVSVGEALAEAMPHLGRRALWCAIDSRRGRIFLERDGVVTTMALDDLPRPDGPVAIAGDAAIAVAARLAAREADVMLTDARLPVARHVALVGERRLAGDLPPRAPQPIYVDPPEARLPAAGLRPAPAP